MSILRTTQTRARIALVAATLAQGSGGLGILLGVLFVAAGAGRLYLARGGRR